MKSYITLIVLFTMLGSIGISSSQKDPTKLNLNKIMGPSLRVLYWKVFEQYANILQERYPDISILGDNYPPPDWKMHAAHILGIAKHIFLVCILFSINLWAWLRIPSPSWWTWLVENKIYGCMMIFFLSNAVEGQLISTGAFEISYNDVPVWSKLETGRIPQPPELFQIIDNHVRLNQDQFQWSDSI